MQNLSKCQNLNGLFFSSSVKGFRFLFCFVAYILKLDTTRSEGILIFAIIPPKIMRNEKLNYYNFAENSCKNFLHNNKNYTDIIDMVCKVMYKLVLSIQR